MEKANVFIPVFYYCIFIAKKKEKTTCSQPEPLFHEILSTFILVLKLNGTVNKNTLYYNIFQFNTLTESDQYP